MRASLGGKFPEGYRLKGFVTHSVKIPQQYLGQEFVAKQYLQFVIRESLEGLYYSQEKSPSRVGQFFA